MKARRKHARSKQITSAHKDSNPTTACKAEHNSLSPTPAGATGLTRGIWLQILPLACLWFVLACLACAALFPGPKSNKNFSAPEKLFPSPRLLCNLIHAKINCQALAWWNIWPITLFGVPAPKKTFRDLIFVFPPLPLQPNTRQKKNFRALAWWNIWPIALFEMPAPEKTFRDLKSFFFPPPPLQPNATPKWICKTLTIWTP